MNRNAPNKKTSKKFKETLVQRCFNKPFDRFWATYPKQQAKQDALNSFRKLDPNETLLTVIIGAVGLRAASEEWRCAGGRYIPLPASYLRGRRWEDEEMAPDEIKPKRKLLNMYSTDKNV